ncbi:hypothetical protein PhaeoP83_01453 [Phaeobacter inhibens]|uniref:Transposase n=1 Tax=Phaeobacter inhibens TaxID=221822 RepID=A0ABM6RD10_9RHOB|nr:hypothetical protein PhaeoP83_01453 [Phaeobacter inhibens]AUQ94286.1 hypothetical protein PhaeoP66_01500 [Phaeobacter inhibens]AUR19536.1 hypothetical protein PhaeoP80_01453 [Phaeobacter inhibens]
MRMPQDLCRIPARLGGDLREISDHFAMGLRMIALSMRVKRCLANRCIWLKPAEK